MKWRTFYGYDLPINELSHQHLSNIIWYYKLILNYNFDINHEIYNELNNRFGGICLPYKPLHSFVFEINRLFELGYITNKLNSDIIVDGKWVGKLSYD